VFELTMMMVKNKIMMKSQSIEKKLKFRVNDLIRLNKKL